MPISTFISPSSAAGLAGSRSGSPSTLEVGGNVRYGSSPSSGIQKAGFRFANINIPKNAVINSAKLRFAFTSPSMPTGSIPFHVRSRNNANPTNWTATTVAASDYISGNIAELILFNSMGGPYAGPVEVDILIQLKEIIDLPAWVSGNAVAFYAHPPAGIAGSDQIIFKDSESSATAFQPELVVNWEYPSLNQLSLTKDTAPVDLMDGEFISGFIGATPGSSIVVNSDSSAPFGINASGSTLYGDSSLVQGSQLVGPTGTVYNLTLTEYLDGTSNNGRVSEVTLRIVDPPPYDIFVISGGTNNFTLPDLLPGDYVIAAGYRDGSNTPPTAPSGWNNILGATGTQSNSMRLVTLNVTSKRVQQTTTMSNATTVTAVVYRPRPGNSFNGISIPTGGGSTGNITAVNLIVIDKAQKTSIVGQFLGHRRIDTNIRNPPHPALYLRNREVDTVDEMVYFDSGFWKEEVDYSTTAYSPGGTNSGWYRIMFEIRTNFTNWMNNAPVEEEPINLGYCVAI